MKYRKNTLLSTTHYPLITFLFLLTIISCDISGSRHDILDLIDKEVAWAKADKLTVRLEYPSAWGTSNPGQGGITPAKDIREGYEFTLEFTPSTAYTLKSWQVFRTADLNNLPGNWVEDTSLINPTSTVPLGPDKVKLTPITTQGGTYKFTIKTTEPVTLVPWCEVQPRITRTDPRNSPSGNPYATSSAIVIYFNSELKPDTVKFADIDPDTVVESMSNVEKEKANGVWITAKLLNGTTETNKDNDWYNPPAFAIAEGFYMVTISPKSTLPPEGSLMTVKVKGIQNTDGKPIDGVYTFSWKTRDGFITSWNAEYIYTENVNSGSIKVDCTKEGVNDVKTYYRLNSGSKILFNERINNIPGPDASGVREGRSVSGIREYEIFIEMYDGNNTAIESAYFKIWNIPGMKVSNDSPAMEIRTQAELAGMTVGDQNVQYVLANDIAVDDWTPVGTDNRANDFQGNLYGNGHTVTINNFTLDSTTTNMGLFGVVSDGTVRDLTVGYNSVLANITDSVRFGGIAGIATGKAQFLNVLVKGSCTLNVDDTIYAGGIAGYMAGTSTVNVFSGLNLTVNKSAADNSIFVGGVMGYGTGSSDVVTVEQARITGDITVGGSESVNVLNNTNSIFTEGLFVGGLAGYIRGAVLKNSDYRQGTIKVRSNMGTAQIGGAVGRSSNNVTVTGCSSVARSIEISKEGAASGTESEILYLGGFVGDFQDGKMENCFNASPVIMNNDSSGEIYIVIGGFAGEVRTSIAYCYAIGNISVFSSYELFAGGFIGQMGDKADAQYCYAKGNVSAISRATDPYAWTSAGGFSGSFGFITDCYALGDVFVDASGPGAVYGGGIIGAPISSNNYLIKRCFATGSVVVQRSAGGSDTAAGGIAGLVQGWTVQDNVAMGASVTITGPGGKIGGRIFGSGFGSTRTNNHAYNDMAVTRSNDYGAPSGERGLFPLVKGRGNKDGADAHYGIFRDRRFWTNPPPFDPTVPPDHNSVVFDIAVHGLGFSSVNWDFSTVEERGYPVLRGSLRGPRMGGQ